MLNQYLPDTILQHDLKEFMTDWGFLLNQLTPEEITPLPANLELLSKLHHALSIDRYSKVGFRQTLLGYAPYEEIRTFANNLGIELPREDTPSFRNKLASFTWGHNEKTKEFVKSFEYSDYLIPNQIEKQTTKNTIFKSENPYKPFKDYQFDIFVEASERVEYANKKFLIQMPTGSGKTKVATEIIASFLNQKNGRQVVWLSDRKELCEQAMDAFENTWAHLGLHDLVTYRLWGEDTNIPTKIEEDSFIVAMYQKIRNPLKNGTLNLSADLIVADEAHNSLAKTYLETIDKLSDLWKKQTRVIGLTATPGRQSNNDAENQKLASAFNGELVGSDITIKLLQQKGILARCIRKPLETNLEYKLTEKEWDDISKSFSRDYPDGLLERIAKDNIRNTVIIKRMLELAKECKHILVFGASKHQSKLLCGIMIAMGHRAAHIDGETPANYRKDTVMKFKDDEIQFVFNYGVFTAGFDAPNIDAVVIARPTTSIVLYAQMIGRGMRGPSLGGTKEFQLVDVVDNIVTEQSGLDNVYEFFAEYWE